MSPANRRTADTSVIAAVHHPLRRRLIDLIGAEGSSTASRLAEAAGELVGNVSHHLKVLAAAGVIEEAPELAKNRRERWWRMAPAVYSAGAEGAAGFLVESWVTLTPERLAELSGKLRDLLQEYSDDPSPEAAAEPILVLAYGVAVWSEQ